MSDPGKSCKRLTRKQRELILKGEACCADGEFCSLTTNWDREPELTPDHTESQGIVRGDATFYSPGECSPHVRVARKPCCSSEASSASYEAFHEKACFHAGSGKRNDFNETKFTKKLNMNFCPDIMLCELCFIGGEIGFPPPLGRKKSAVYNHDQKHKSLLASFDDTIAIADAQIDSLNRLQYLLVEYCTAVELEEWKVQPVARDPPAPQMAPHGVRSSQKIIAEELKAAGGPVVTVKKLKKDRKAGFSWDDRRNSQRKITASNFIPYSKTIRAITTNLSPNFVRNMWKPQTAALPQSSRFDRRYTLQTPIDPLREHREFQTKKSKSDEMLHIYQKTNLNTRKGRKFLSRNQTQDPSDDIAWAGRRNSRRQRRQNRNGRLFEADKSCLADIPSESCPLDNTNSIANSSFLRNADFPKQSNEDEKESNFETAWETPKDMKRRKKQEKKDRKKNLENERDDSADERFGSRFRKSMRSASSKLKAMVFLVPTHKED